MNLKSMRSLLGFSFISLGILVFMLSCAPTPTVERRPTARQTCAQCHPELVAAYSVGVVHKPVMEKNCEACHLPHGMVPSVLLREQVPLVCLPCHAEFKQVEGKTSLHKPVNNGECESCHNPHNSEQQNLLNSAALELCFDCHEREPFARETVHAPVQDGCADCHLPHMSDNMGL